MRTSRKLTHVLFAVFTLAMMSMAALAADPGTAISAESEASDQKQGSLLIYNYYRSDSANVSATDTKINITNTNVTSSVVVHFFFVSVTAACAVADFKTELTQSQTYSFLVSDFDPDSQGYIMAVAENEDGLPIAFNYLIGDLYLKDTLKQANLGAISFAADWAYDTAIGSASASTVDITFNTAGSNTYNSLPATLALSNIPSLAAGDRTFLVINRPSGSFVTGPTSVGTLFGLLFDDAEQSQSFQISGACQLSGVLSDSFPRTAPRFSTVIPAGRTGWMKVYATNGTTGIVGSQVVYNLADNVNFWGGHNLHALTLTSSANTATLPVFPFELQTN
jgi:hypothetical protein